MSKKIKEVKQKIKQLREDIFVLENTLDELYKNQLIKCTKCKKKSIARSLVAYQTYYYVYSMDDWYHSDVYFKCPKCEVYNRLMDKKYSEHFCRYLASKTEDYVSEGIGDKPKLSINNYSTIEQQK